MDVEKKLAEIIERVVGKTVTAGADSTLEQMNLDSLDLFEIAEAAEKEFNISFGDMQLSKEATFGDLVKTIKSKI